MPHLSFDKVELQPGMKVYQLDTRNNNVRLWEFQVLELLAGDKVKIFHLNPAESKSPMQMNSPAGGVCADRLTLLREHDKNLRAALESIPAMLSKLTDAITNPDGFTNPTTVVAEFASRSEEI